MGRQLVSCNRCNGRYSHDHPNTPNTAMKTFHPWYKQNVKLERIYDFQIIDSFSMRSLPLKLLVDRTYCEEERRSDREYIKHEYPNHVVVLLRYGGGGTRFWRYVIDASSPFRKLMHAVRKTRKVPPSVALLFLLETHCGRELQVPGNMDMGEIESLYAHPDGFLYVNSLEENCFG